MSKYTVFYPAWTKYARDFGGGGAVGAFIGVICSHYFWVVLIQALICGACLLAFIIALFSRKSFRKRAYGRFAMQGIQQSDIRFQ